MVHINTNAIRANYAAKPSAKMHAVLDLIDKGHLISLTGWLKALEVARGYRAQ